MASIVADHANKGARNPNVGSFPDYRAGRLTDLGVHDGGSNVIDSSPARSPFLLREGNKRKTDLFEDWGSEDAEPL